MNLLPRWAIPLAALAPLAAGCAQQTVAPAPVEVVKRPTPTAVTPMQTNKTEQKLDCCALPKKSLLVFTALKTARTEGQKAPVTQTNKATGGVSIKDFLQPAGPAVSWVLEKQPRKTLPPPAFLEHPESVFQPIAGDLVRPALELPQVVMLPRPLPEDAPLSRQHREPKLPERQPLPAKPLIRLPRVDLEKPGELPPLAKFQPERAPLTDVTGAASLEAVLTTPIPVRATPEPFVRFNLPEPFEFRTIRLPSPPDEK